MNRPALTFRGGYVKIPISTSSSSTVPGTSAELAHNETLLPIVHSPVILAPTFITTFLPIRTP